MKTVTAVLILGGGVAVLAAVAHAKAQLPPNLYQSPQDEINASIQKSLAEIARKKTQ